MAKHFSAQQKRAAFRREFGERLLPHGFLYRDKRFIRVHPGQLMLVVELYLAPSGNSYLQFGAKPMCAGIKDEPPCGEFRPDTLRSLHPNPELFFQQALVSKDFEERLAAQKDFFFSAIFDTFNSAVDTASWLKADAWLRQVNGIYAQDRQVLGSIMVQDYSGARECIASSIASHVLSISQLRQNLDHCSRQESRDRYDAEMIGLLNENIALDQQHIHRLEHWRDMLDRRDLAPLIQIIEGNLRQADGVCRARYPEFYK